MSPIEIVRAKEEEIKNNRFESAFAVDETGGVILDKPGEQYHVGFTQQEIDLLRAGRGVIFTHNHPRGWNYPADSPLRAGSSFSDTDIEFACRVNVAETRVVTPMQRYFVRPAPEGWSLTYWEKTLKPVYDLHAADVERQFRLLVLQRQMSWEEAGAREMHEVWSRVAAETNLTYGREQE